MGNAGKVIGFRVSRSATAFVTLDGNASETIDGELTRMMWAQESAILLCTDSGWTKLSGRTRPTMCGMRVASATPTAAQLIPNNAPTKVLVNQTDFDQGGIADLVNNRMVARRSGKYSVGFIVYYNVLTTGNPVPRVLGNVSRADGSRAAQAESSAYSSSSYPAVNVSVLAELAAGEILTFNTFQNSGGDRQLYGDPSTAATLFTIHEVVQW